MKKTGKLLLLLSLVITIAVLGACTGTKLSEDFKENEVKAAAERVIELVNTHDGAGLRELSTVALKDGLTDEVLQKVWAAVDEGGKFDKIEEISLTGVKDPKSGEEFAGAVVKAKYELKSFIYTLSFTKQMKLAGIYFK